jgi:alpha-D-ribose 1-methylphosphonate 5-phosphate C-P lyase
MHAEGDYVPMWLFLYESIVRFDEVMLAAGYPVRVNGRYIMSPSPIPRWDIPRLNMSENLFLFGAGREKRIYAVPPHTEVEPLQFEDYPFKVEDFCGRSCELCGSASTYLDEIVEEGTGRRFFRCSDTAYCAKNTGA